MRQGDTAAHCPSTKRCCYRLRLLQLSPVAAPLLLLQLLLESKAARPQRPRSCCCCSEARARGSNAPMRVAAGLPPPPAANGVVNHGQHLSLEQVPTALIKLAEADAADALGVGQNRGRVCLWRVRLAALGQALGALAPAAADAPQEAWGGGRGGKSQGQQQPERPMLFPSPRARRKA